MCNASTCDCECNKACKIDKYLDIQNCSCEKCLIGKLVLKCEDKILNTTETSPGDKKVTCKKIVFFTRLLSYSHDFIINCKLT